MYYKMKAILLVALAAIMLSQSYGLAYGADIVTVATDSSSYETGDVISVSGSVSDYDGSDLYESSVVAVRLIAPNNNIISVFQLPLSDDGSYSSDSLDKAIIAGGPQWKFDGDYTISVNHGADRSASITFAFVSSEIEAAAAEEEAEAAAAAAAAAAAEAAAAAAAEAAEAAEKCGEGTHLEDGVCVLDEIIESTSVSTGSSPTTGSTSLMYSITFTVLIAFAISIILYCISRASKNKTVN